MAIKPPILFLVFNRPQLTKKVFSEIRRFKPKKLFISADGPRSGNSQDRILCKRVRKITEKVDWPCEVKRLYRDGNLGCKNSISKALSWFFENENEGIILEDDCLPDTTFFQFCGEMLEKYRHNKDVGIISGDNFIKGSTIEDSYYFSNYFHMWGWATWKRSWKSYDLTMRKWPKLNKDKWLEQLFIDKNEANYWKTIFNRVYKEKVDTWDYQWIYSSWLNNSLSIVPNINLVKNIGLGDVGTHVTGSVKYKVNKHKIVFPLKHPTHIERNIYLDKLESDYFYNKKSSVLRKILGIFSV